VATFHRSPGAAIRGDRANLAAHREAFARFRPDVVLDTIAYTEKDAATLVAVFRGMTGRTVVLSSQDVYASYGRLLGLEAGPPDRMPAAEDSPRRASRFPYRGKARGVADVAYDYEKVLVERAAWSDPALPTTILRLPCVYGAGDGHHRVGEVLAQALAGPPFLLDRAKAAWRWTRSAVDNVGEAIALAVVDPRAAGRVYNVGEEPAPMEEEWIRAILRAAGIQGEVHAVARAELPAGVAEPFDFSHDLVADTSRIRRELGYREVVGRDSALAEAVAWERAHPATAGARSRE